MRHCDRSYETTRTVSVRRVLHTRGLPQIEARERTIRALRAFWSGKTGPQLGPEYTPGMLCAPA